MLIDSVVIVLREALEAALLISVLLAAARRLALPRPRFGLGVGLGILGAGIFAASLRRISGWFEGAGYELANSALQLLIYAAVLVIIGLLGRGRDPRRAATALPWAMVAAVGLAIIREGSEILLYFGSFMQQIGATTDALIGAALGLGVGFSAGALFYYLLLALPLAGILPVAAGLLALIGAGMCAQAVRLLVQIDWLPAQPPLWDTSAWLPEQSPLGQLLYALLGYEATPSPLQAVVYLACITLAAGVAVGARLSYRREGPVHD